jgi:hypothetical protein
MGGGAGPPMHQIVLGLSWFCHASNPVACSLRWLSSHLETDTLPSLDVMRKRRLRTCHLCMFWRAVITIGRAECKVLRGGANII